MFSILPKKPSNPDGILEELIRKRKAGILNYEESIKLREILARVAEQSDEARKSIVTLRLLALFIYALTESSDAREEIRK